MALLSRRNILKTSALLPAALAMRSAQAVNNTIPEKWDEECDVLVVGGGGAALHAAIQAHNAGGKVIIANKSPNSYFTATALCGAAFTSYRSRMQQLAKIQDSVDDFVEDMLKFGGYWADPELLRVYALYSGPTFDWLEDHGLREHFLEQYSEFRKPRTARQKAFSGKDYIDVLVAETKNRNIERYDNSPLSRIIYDVPNNRVLGAEIQSKQGPILIKAKRGVVMAAGGYMGNTQFVDRWIPTLGGVGVVLNTPSNDGSALMTVVRDVGAPLTHMQFFGGYPNGALNDEGSRDGRICRTWYFVGDGAIYVSKKGRRFVDETTGSCQIAPLLGALPEKRNFCVMEAGTWKAINDKYPSGTFGGWNAEQVKAAVEKGNLVYFGDTIEDVAKKAGVDPEGLKGQIEEWNGYVEAGKDGQFGRQDLPKKIINPPFCIIKLASYSVISGGGLRCDKDLRVLRWDNKPVEGLWAAGEIIGAVHGNAYSAGTGTGSAQTFGWVAGHNVMGKPLPQIPEQS